MTELILGPWTILVCLAIYVVGAKITVTGEIGDHGFIGMGLMALVPVFNVLVAALVIIDVIAFICVKVVLAIRR